MLMADRALLGRHRCWIRWRPDVVLL